MSAVEKAVVLIVQRDKNTTAEHKIPTYNPTLSDKCSICAV